MMSLALMLTLATPGVSRGEALSAQRCTVCHGEKGSGDGVVAVSLAARPANLTIARLSLERLVTVMSEGVPGVPGTAIPVQRELAAADRAALIAFVQSLGPLGRPPAASAKELKPGQNVFAIRCFACHGASADGEGPAASQLGRRTTDFTRKRRAGASATAPPPSTC